MSPEFIIVSSADVYKWLIEKFDGPGDSESLVNKINKLLEK